MTDDARSKEDDEEGFGAPPTAEEVTLILEGIPEFRESLAEAERLYEAGDYVELDDFGSEPSNKELLDRARARVRATGARYPAKEILEDRDADRT